MKFHFDGKALDGFGIESLRAFLPTLLPTLASEPRERIRIDLAPEMECEETLYLFAVLAAGGCKEIALKRAQ